MRRDFTYISDAAEATISLLDRLPNNASIVDSHTLFKVVNVGCDKPIELLLFIELLESSLGVKAKKRLIPMQAGDVVATWADLDELTSLITYNPKIKIQEGIFKWTEWYLNTYGGFKHEVQL